MSAATWRALVALAAVIAPLACKDDATNGGTPGILRVTLTTPNSGQDGAAVIVLSGPMAPRGVQAGTGLTLWGGPVQSAQATVALTGTLSTGTILTIDVADVDAVASYTATLREVSRSDSTVALRELTGYVLAVVR